MMLSIIKETGWTWDYLLWRISWVNVRMMLADAPGYKKQTEPVKHLETEDDFKAFLKL